MPGCTKQGGVLGTEIMGITIYDWPGQNGQNGGEAASQNERGEIIISIQRTAILLGEDRCMHPVAL
jgi:hypothetical protein